MKILNRFSGKVIFEFECNTVKECLIKAKESGADLRGANLSGADLRDADLSGAYLRGADLRGADLSGAYLRDANLWGADLSGADLRDANLSGANLSGADLSDADLRDANLSDANLSGADLSGANLWGANLWGDRITKLPIYINAGLNWQVWITDKKIKIGCQIHTTSFWVKASDEVIRKMSVDALDFWHKWKNPILVMAKEHQKIGE